MSFLSKKSWHARSTRNVAKVWQAEQDHEEEQRKIAQRIKELQEEHELEALRRIQANASGRPVEETRIEWMYQTPASALNEQTENEAYLMGKQVKSVPDDQQLSRTQNAVGSLFVKAETSGPSDLDVRAKMKEDPLYMMMQRETEYMSRMNTASLKIQRLRQLRRNEREESQSERRSVSRSDRRRDDDSRSDRRRNDDLRLDRRRDDDLRLDRRRNDDLRSDRRRNDDLRSDRRRDDDSRSDRRRDDDLRSDRRRDDWLDDERRRSSRAPPDRCGWSSRDMRGRGHIDEPRRGRRDEDSEDDRCQLEAMRQNAEQMRAARRQLVQDLAGEREREHAENSERGRELQPQFISEMGRSVYADPKLGSLEDRLATRRFYIQRDTN